MGLAINLLMAMITFPILVITSILLLLLVMTMTERLASHFIFRVAKVSPAGTDDTAGCTNITSALSANFKRSLAIVQTLKLHNIDISGTLVQILK